MSFSVQKTSGEGPSERMKCASCVVGNKVYIMGGVAGRDAKDDMWSLDLSLDPMKWEIVHQKGLLPSPRWGHSACAFANDIYLFGGNSVDGMLNELLIFSTATNTWKKAEYSSDSAAFLPSPRMGHTATILDTPQKSMWIFGGDPIEDEAETMWWLDFGEMKWNRRWDTDEGGAWPDPRHGHIACGRTGDKIVLHGGWGLKSNQYLDDVWVFFTTKGWVRAQTKGFGPSPRGGHVAEILGDFLFVFGGWGPKEKFYDEIHYLNLKGFSWLKKSVLLGGIKPKERHRASHFLLPESHPNHKTRIFLFGGQLGGQEEYLNELISLDTSSIY